MKLIWKLDRSSRESESRIPCFDKLKSREIRNCYLISKIIADFKIH